MSGKGTLHLDHCRHAGSRRGEHGEQTITRAPDFPTLAGSEPRSDDLMMVGVQTGVHLIADSLQERR
jgi:hypothetical protein